MKRLSRRAVAAGLPAAALAGRALAKDVDVQGRSTYSESAMVMSVSDDGTSAVTLRFCRFPDVGVTWLWCHLLRDGQIYAFTRHDLPCAPQRLADQPDATYEAAGVQAALRRKGQGRAMQAVSISTQLGFHRSAHAPMGEGSVAGGIAGGVPGSLAGIFSPTHVLGAQVLKDRDEVYGTLTAKLAAGRERWLHQGLAKFHEQRQTGPRFGPPFNYSWLSGPDTDATTLLVERGASGGWVFGDAEEALADMSVDPPGAERNVVYRLASGRRMTGRLTALARYEIPIFGRRWQGSFVHGTVDGRPVVGAMNDWTTSPDIYAAATARNR